MPCQGLESEYLISKAATKKANVILDVSMAPVAVLLVHVAALKRAMPPNLRLVVRQKRMKTLSADDSISLARPELCDFFSSVDVSSA